MNMERKERAMSDKLIKYIELRLEHWAKWFGKGNGSGLGFLPCSIEYRLMTEGMIIRQYGPAPLPCNDEAEEIEGFLREIAEQNRKIADALRCH